MTTTDIQERLDELDLTNTVMRRIYYHVRALHLRDDTLLTDLIQAVRADDLQVADAYVCLTLRQLQDYKASDDDLLTSQLEHIIDTIVDFVTKRLEEELDVISTPAARCMEFEYKGHRSGIYTVIGMLDFDRSVQGIRNYMRFFGGLQLLED